MDIYVSQAKRKICKNVAEIYHLMKDLRKHTDLLENINVRAELLTEFKKCRHIPPALYIGMLQKIENSKYPNADLMCDFFELKEHLTDTEYKYFMEHMSQIQSNRALLDIWDEILIDLLMSHSGADYNTAAQAYNRNNRNILFALRP